MLHMVTFTINIPQMLAYIYQHHGSYGYNYIGCGWKLVPLSLMLHEFITMPGLHVLGWLGPHFPTSIGMAIKAPRDLWRCLLSLLTFYGEATLRSFMINNVINYLQMVGLLNGGFPT